MSELKILLPEEAYADLASLATQPRIVEGFANAEAEISRAPNLAAAVRAVASTTALPFRDVARVARALLAMHSVRRNLRLDAEDLIEVLHLSVKDQAPPSWKETHLDGWHAIRPLLLTLLCADHPLGTLEKAERLAYSYARILTDATVITDVRPVFDEAAHTVKRMSVSFVLALDFNQDGHAHRIDLALDAQDLDRLVSQCQRAQQKAQTLRKELGGLSATVAIAGQVEGTPSDGN